MKPAVRVMSTITTIWTILVIVLIVLMILPVVPGTVQVRVPPSDSWVTSIDNGTVTMTNNISVRNYGLFPFKDFFFVVELYGTNNSVLAKFNSTQSDLLTYRWVDIPITFEVNRSNIEDAKLRDIIFNEVTFGGLFYFNTRYLLDFRAQLGFNGSVSMGPLIHSDFRVNQTNLTQQGGNTTIQVPYSLESSQLLADRNISLSGTISNDTQTLGAFNKTIALGQSVQDNLTVDLTREAYDHLSSSSDHLTINVTVAIGEFVWNYELERDWQPPSGG